MQADLTRLGSSSPLDSRKQTWVQTERSVHEAWAALCSTKPRAAALLHTMVAHMDSRAAIVASRETLAELANCSVATIKRSVADLKEGKWIQVVQVGGKGGVNAYAINSRVAWGDERKHLPFAAFTATVLASRKEQEPQDLIENAPLRRLPTLYRGERQLPAGDGGAPPVQQDLPGVENEVPAIQEKTDLVTGEITPVQVDEADMTRRLRNI